jgi:hypothetical protein
MVIRLYRAEASKAQGDCIKQGNRVATRWLRLEAMNSNGLGKEYRDAIGQLKSCVEGVTYGISQQ